MVKHIRLFPVVSSIMLMCLLSANLFAGQVAKTSEIVYDTTTEGRLKIVYPPEVRVGEKFQIHVSITGYARIYEFFVDRNMVCNSWSWTVKNKTYAHPHAHKDVRTFKHDTEDRLPPSVTEDYYLFDAPGEHEFSVQIIHCEDPDYALCGHNRLKSDITVKVKVLP